MGAVDDDEASSGLVRISIATNFSLGRARRQQKGQNGYVEARRGGVHTPANHPLST